jgi:hypothetical protein
MLLYRTSISHIYQQHFHRMLSRLKNPAHRFRQNSQCRYTRS